jgi:steroid delta-isomerase-like uncharacterized protein
MSDRCDIVRRFLDAFYGSRWDELLSLVTDDVVYVDPLLPEPKVGKEQLQEVLAYCHSWATYSGELVTVFGSGRHVAVEQRIRGVVTSPPEGMTDAVVGKPFEFVEADVFEFDDDNRICRETVYPDALTLEHQLGEAF